jgi:hypothetical protein
MRRLALVVIVFAAGSGLGLALGLHLGQGRATTPSTTGDIGQRLKRQCESIIDTADPGRVSRYDAAGILTGHSYGDFIEDAQKGLKMLDDLERSDPGRAEAAFQKAWEQKRQMTIQGCILARGMGRNSR